MKNWCPCAGLWWDIGNIKEQPTTIISIWLVDLVFTGYEEKGPVSVESLNNNNVLNVLHLKHRTVCQLLFHASEQVEPTQPLPGRWIRTN